MEILDQMGNRIHLSNYPGRIISLVPSLTELLFDLGLDDEIVGLTDYCVVPIDKVADKVKVGGPKLLNFHAIDALQPDLLIGDKEENDRAQILALQKKYPIWMSNIVTLENALNMILSVGGFVNRVAEAAHLVNEITTAFDGLPPFTPLKVAYLIWKNPYMVAAGNTFINTMLHKCGFTNIFEHQLRYPRIELDELADADVILLSSEPYSFSEQDLEYFQAGLSTTKILLVDGRMFSWYGSHLRHVPSYFVRLRNLL